MLSVGIRERDWRWRIIIEETYWGVIGDWSAIFDFQKPDELVTYSGFWSFKTISKVVQGAPVRFADRLKSWMALVSPASKERLDSVHTGLVPPIYLCHAFITLHFDLTMVVRIRNIRCSISPKPRPPAISLSPRLHLRGRALGLHLRHLASGRASRRSLRRRFGFLRLLLALSCGLLLLGVLDSLLPSG